MPGFVATRPGLNHDDRPFQALSPNETQKLAAEPAPTASSARAAKSKAKKNPPREV
jgi:hypothetical protein